MPHCFQNHIVAVAPIVQASSTLNREPRPLPRHERVRHADGATLYDATTQAVIDYLLSNAHDAWNHLICILRRATSSLFLPAHRLRVERPGGGITIEDSRSMTREWIEDWLRTKLAPWHRDIPAEILQAANRGEFRYLGHECRCDLLNEIERWQRDAIEVGIDPEEIAEHLNILRRNPWNADSAVVTKSFDPAKYLPLATKEQVGDLAVGLQARLGTFALSGDIKKPDFESAVIEHTKREIGQGLERAKQYDIWFKKHAKLALPRNHLLQAIHADLVRPDPLVPFRPAKATPVPQPSQ